MALVARSTFTTDNDSAEAGRRAATVLLEPFQDPPKVAVCYLTINHDQPAFLRGMRDVLGRQTCLLGCSGQGVMSSGVVREEGYVAGALAIGGDSVEIAGGQVREIQTDTFDKGRVLGQTIAERLAERPKIAVLNFDPLSGANMDPFLEGLHSELDCPIVGGAAGHFHGPMRETFQYFGQEVFMRGAVAFALSGAVTPELAITTGVSPVGIEMTVTRCDGNNILELDGQRALDVWQEITSGGPPDLDNSAALAIGVPVRSASESGGYLIRAAFGVDADRGGIIVQSEVPLGTTVMLHHRTVDDVLEGSRRMGEALRERLNGKTPRAVLGFECGARTLPFLGAEATQQENILLQQTVAESAEWLGPLVWGEVFPLDGRPVVHNYTYAVLAIAD